MHTQYVALACMHNHSLAHTDLLTHSAHIFSLLDEMQRHCTTLTQAVQRANDPPHCTSFWYSVCMYVHVHVCLHVWLCVHVWLWMLFCLFVCNASHSCKQNLTSHTDIQQDTTQACVSIWFFILCMYTHNNIPHTHTHTHTTKACA